MIRLSLREILFSNEEAKSWIEWTIKKDGGLYSDTLTDELIIRLYYAYVKRPSFSRMLSNFERRYLYNENKMEQVHTKEEKKGLGIVYNKYILENVDLNLINIAILNQIHRDLFSKVPYPEFGGKFRTGDVVLVGKDKDGNPITAGIDITPYNCVGPEIGRLHAEVLKLVKRGSEIGNKLNSEDFDLHETNDELINYIKDCVILKCKLIKIHPFFDGNGRSIRVFLNILFKIANIPPVYIENREKFAYQKAMNRALRSMNNSLASDIKAEDINYDEFSDIIQFYFHKICDSIVALDDTIRKPVTYVDIDSVEELKEDMKK